MATKIIKALIDGVIQDIEVEDITSPEPMPSVEERVDKLEDKHEVVFTDGNLLVGNGTEELEEMTPDEVLSHINGASVATMTTAEYEAMSDDEVNANAIYVLTDSEDDYYTKDEIDTKIDTHTHDFELIVYTTPITSAKSITPTDNSVTKCELSASVTFAMTTTTCPVYSAYYMFTILSGGSIAFSGTYRELLDPDGIIGGTLTSGDTIEISIFNGSVIVKNTSI